MSQNVREIANFIWTVADELLRDSYKRSEYADVIYPFTVLRRLDLILEPTHEKVLQTEKQFKKQIQDRSEILKQAAGAHFYNISNFTFAKLLNDSNNIHINFIAYLNGFSENIKEILLISLTFDM